MNEASLAKNIRNSIWEKIQDLYLAWFISDEVNKITSNINYYKLSNLYKNVDDFCNFVDWLNFQYNKDIQESLHKISCAFDKKIDKNVKDDELINVFDNIQEILDSLPEDLKNSLVYNISSDVWEEFFQELFICDFVSSKDKLFQTLEDFLAKIAYMKLKYITILNLSILEYTNSPYRITMRQRAKVLDSM